MSIGRREFLKYASLALAGLADYQAKAVCTNKNYYVNKKFGIILEKPDNWEFVSINEFERVFDEQIINDDWVDKAEVAEIFGQPAFMIAKYWPESPENRDMFSPAIVAYITHKSELDFDYESFEELIKLSGEGTAVILKNYNEWRVEGPISICGREAYIRHASYTFEHVRMKGGGILTRLTVLIIEHNDFYYYINMHDSDEVGENAYHEFQKFIKSIVLA